MRAGRLFHPETGCRVLKCHLSFRPQRSRKSRAPHAQKLGSPAIPGAVDRKCTAERLISPPLQPVDALSTVALPCQNHREPLASDAANLGSSKILCMTGEWLSTLVFRAAAPNPPCGFGNPALQTAWSPTRCTTTEICSVERLCR